MSEKKETASSPQRTTKAEKPAVELLTGPNAHKKVQPKPGDPPMDIGRLSRYIADPRAGDNERLAKELLQQCGPLVIPPNYYQLDAKGGIEAIPTKYLEAERKARARNLESMRPAE